LICSCLFANVLVSNRHNLGDTDSPMTFVQDKNKVNIRFFIDKTIIKHISVYFFMIILTHARLN
jgi:hypothetical protein